jgi:hypothetical protein
MLGMGAVVGLLGVGTAAREKMETGKELTLVVGTRVRRGRNIRSVREAWGRRSDGVPRVGVKENLSGTSGFDMRKRKFRDDSREDDNGADKSGFTRKSASTITCGKFSGRKRL